MEVYGLGKKERNRLSEIIRKTRGTISVKEASDILEVSSSDAAKMLARWAEKGWVSRIRRGIYVPMRLESTSKEVPLEDSWVAAERLYSPCYIGGWSAAEYWDLTEQIFRTVFVMTNQKPRQRSQIIKGTNFKLKSVSQNSMFGLKPVWRGQVKVMVSDPARTIIDMLNDLKLGGGIRPTVDMFLEYLKTENKRIELLINYADRLGNGAVIKRLGFLLERYRPNELDAIESCKSKLTKGYAKLDPSLKSNKLITRWRLWISKGWDMEKQV